MLLQLSIGVTAHRRAHDQRHPRILGPAQRAEPEERQQPLPGNAAGGEGIQQLASAGRVLPIHRLRQEGRPAPGSGAARRGLGPADDVYRFSVTRSRPAMPTEGISLYLRRVRAHDETRRLPPRIRPGRSGAPAGQLADRGAASQSSVFRRSRRPSPSLPAIAAAGRGQRCAATAHGASRAVLAVARRHRRVVPGELGGDDDRQALASCSRISCGRCSKAAAVERDFEEEQVESVVVRTIDDFRALRLLRLSPPVGGGPAAPLVHARRKPTRSPAPAPPSRVADLLGERRGTRLDELASRSRRPRWRARRRAGSAPALGCCRCRSRRRGDLAVAVGGWREGVVAASFRSVSCWPSTTTIPASRGFLHRVEDVWRSFGSLPSRRRYIAPLAQWWGASMAFQSRSSAPERSKMLFRSG